jgi:hypothetical protein
MKRGDMTQSPGWKRLDAAVAGGHLWPLAAAVGAALAATGLFAGVASAKPKSETLHFYQVQVGPTQFYNASGRPINLNPPTTLPKPGDSFDETHLDYVGTAKHHASHWTATDHFTCTFTGADTGRCDAQVAIGGSLLLSNNFPLPTTARAVVAINEGTGAFHGVRGRFTDANVPNSSNAILTIHLP